MSPRTLNTLFLRGSGSLWPSLSANVSEGALGTSSQVLYPLVQVIAFCLQCSAQLLQSLDFHLQTFQLFVPESFLGREMEHPVRYSFQVWATENEELAPVANWPNLEYDFSVRQCIPPSTYQPDDLGQALAH